MNITDLGWSPFFEKNFGPYQEDGLRPGRVVRVDRSGWRVQSDTGAVSCSLSGKLRYTESASGLPTVGDWVVISGDGSGGQGLIVSVLPRQTAVSRKAAGSGERADEQVLAANVDTVFIVTDLDKDFNPRRIERYLALVSESGAVPAIVLNKADECTDIGPLLNKVEVVAPGVDVFIVSALTGMGMDQLSSFWSPGHTGVMMGSSGVGKSTLINRLLGEQAQETGAIREHDGRGRHTTSHRELVLLPDGCILIDTPGLREIQLWVSSESISNVFGDIEKLSENCRFRDCQHKGEPGCAVEAAIESGDIDHSRLSSYHKLGREQKRLEARQNGTEKHLRKIQGKKMARMINEVKKIKKDKLQR